MDNAAQIPILHKAIDVIHFLAQSEREPTPRETAAALGIAPTSCYRIFQTFSRRNWLRPRADGRYGLSHGLLPVLQRVSQDPLLSAEAAAVLARLTTQTGITSKISVREGREALTILREDSAEPMALSVKAGARFHLGYGSSGAVLLAGCEDAEVAAVLADAPPTCWEFQTPENVRARIAAVRAGGCAMDVGQYRPDVFGVSAPVRDPQGNVSAALTLTGLAYRVSRTELDAHAATLLAAAARLTLLLGNKGGDRVVSRRTP